MNVPPPHPSRSLRWFAAAVKWSLWLLLAAWLVLALAWGALHGWIVPRIGDFRPDLEKRASRTLGVPVRIGQITAQSNGLVPSFELHDVVLHDAQGRAALRLPLVVAALSPRSLWHLGFEQLYIHGPELDIRRARDGRLFVAGLDFSRGGRDDRGAADWFFRQKEFAIRGGTLRWTDELRGAPPLELDQVDFVARNGARRHALRLDATPPAEWGERFTLTGLFRQPLLSTRAGRWEDWVGQIHADFAEVDVSQLRRHVDLDIEVARGRGHVRAWADVDRGLIAGGTADLALSDVSATLGPGLAPLALQTVSGRLGGQRRPNGFAFATQQLQFVTAEGLRWPGGNVSVQWSAPEGAKLAQGELRADQLDLGALTLIASRLPLGTATHAALAAHAPQGLVETLQARWQGPIGELQRYELRGKGVRLALQPRVPAGGGKALPGVRGAAIDFDLTQAGGKAKLALQNGALDLPGVFEQPELPFDALSADLQWQVQGPQVSVSVDNLKFANADAAGEGRATWRTSDPKAAPGGARLPGHLDLQASLSRANGTRVWRYLPLGVNQAAREYVRDSVTAGVATGAKFRVKGDLRDFPFANGKPGEFLITAPVRNVTFAYVPHPAAGALPWPALTDLSAELVFQANGMEIRKARGRFAGPTRLQVQADARIPEFAKTEVLVRGQVRGPLADALAVVQTSPLAQMLNQTLSRATGTGAAEVDLQLALPVGDIARSQVQGTVTLAGNDVQVAPGTPLLARARGAVQFSEKGFQIQGVQARALGGDLRLEGGTRPAPPGEPPPVQLRAQGVVTAEGLRQARDLGFISRLARDFQGSTPYSLVLGFRRGQPELLINTSLQGMAIDLPAPLNKPADTPLPVRYESALTRESLAPGARLQETLAVEVGRLASVTYLRDLAGAEPQVVRGGIAIGLAAGETVPLPEEGVSANIQLAQFDVDAWEAALERAAGAEPAATAGAASAPAPSEPAARDATAPAMGYLPTSMAVRAKTLVVEGRALHNVVMGGSRDGRIWRANVDADELNGYLEYRQPQAAGTGRVFARLARLNIAAATASEVESLLEQQPGSIPALDIVVDDFELKGRKLGRLEIDAVNRGAGLAAREGGVREWRLNRLALTTPEGVLSATGNWAAIQAQAPPAPVRPGGRPAPEKRRTAVKFRLDINDAGQLLARFGMRDVVRRGRGTMEGNVAWMGSPLALDYPSLAGSFNVNVEAGQFLKAEPGIAKLLGVLSLQSLPRRLALDFRDVFSEGFSFDFVRGDIAIEHGIAATNNLQMKGVNAAVLMEGKADIARETQDLKVVVVPEINAGTVSLVATVINPAIGLGTFLAQMFLRQPLMRAATQEFHVDGTWADPRVTKVARTAGAAVPAVPAAPPAVPAPAEPASR